jgi:hypothetical protein
MLRQFKKILTLGIPIIVVILLQMGCKKKDVYPSEQLPIIASLSPSSAIVGTAIVIKGTNLKNVTDVKFGSAEASNFSASNNTDSAIRVTVPAGLTPGAAPVQVYYANGKGYASADFIVVLTPPVPKIDSVSPISAYPGNTVTLSGNNFALVTTVTFNGVVAKFSHSLDTNAKMTAIVPANATGGAQFIKLINPNGSDSVAFNVNLGPVISGINPNSGKAGDSITVTGIRFTGATSVQLNGQTVGFKLWNDSTIKFAVPVGGQNGNVTVTTPLGTAVSPAGFVVIVPISLFVYKDALLANWQISSYTANTSDTTANPESGTNCLYTAYTGGFGAFRLDDFQASSTFVNLTGYSTLRFSVYGGPGTNGNKLSVAINGNYGKTVIVLITEGKYTDYFVPLSSLGSPATLNEVVLQEFSGVGSTTIFVDNVGLN